MFFTHNPLFFLHVFYQVYTNPKKRSFLHVIYLFMHVKLIKSHVTQLDRKGAIKLHVKLTKTHKKDTKTHNKNLNLW